MFVKIYTFGMNQIIERFVKTCFDVWNTNYEQSLRKHEKSLKCLQAKHKTLFFGIKKNKS